MTRYRYVAKTATAPLVLGVRVDMTPGSVHTLSDDQYATLDGTFARANLRKVTE